MLTVRLKNKTWISPQIKNHRKIHELRLIRNRHSTKNRTHMYLNS